MRKKTLLLIFDKMFWFLIMVLPLLAYLLAPLGYSIGGGTSMSSLSGGSIVLPDFSSILGQFGISTNNIVYTSLSSLFGAGGVIEFFNANSVMLLYLSYIIIVEIIHLFVDFLVFIPRLAHKYLDRCTLDVELTSRD